MAEFVRLWYNIGMIEIWSGDTERGTVGAGFTPETAERLALGQAANDGALQVVTLRPGRIVEMTPPGDASPQHTYAYEDNTAEMSELRCTERDGATATYKTDRVRIGPDDHKRRSISYEVEPSDTGTPRRCVYWLVCVQEQTPEFDALREHLSAS